jgi:hypothetical protein
VAIMRIDWTLEQLLAENLRKSPAQAWDQAREDHPELSRPEALRDPNAPLQALGGAHPPEGLFLNAHLPEPAARDAVGYAPTKLPPRRPIAGARSMRYGIAVPEPGILRLHCGSCEDSLSSRWSEGWWTTDYRGVRSILEGSQSPGILPSDPNAVLHNEWALRKENEKPEHHPEQYATVPFESEQERQCPLQ